MQNQVVTLFDVGKRISDLSECLTTPLLSIYDQSNQLPLPVCEGIIYHCFRDSGTKTMVVS